VPLPWEAQINADPLEGTEMRSTVMLACLVLLVVGTQCNAPGFLSSSASDGEARWRLGIEERFAIRYCYRQYNNQTDVDYCLLRAAHLPRRQG
jgi:hypothetical protein